MIHFAMSLFAAVARKFSRWTAAFARWTREDVDPHSPAARALAYDLYIRENIPKKTATHAP